MDLKKMKKQCTMAFGYANARMALNYYTFADDLSAARKVPVYFSRLAEQFSRYIKEYLGGGHPMDEIAGLRREVIREIDKINSYKDSMSIYEYVLNRMEHRFDNTFDIEDPKLVVSEVMRFIIAGRDSLAVNERIRMVVGQLPVRYTRQKFYGMVKEQLAVWLGSEKSSVNRQMYLLRSASMTKRPAEADGAGTGGDDCGRMEQYQTLDEISAWFGQVDYKNPDIGTCREAKHKKHKAVEILEAYTLWYMSLQELLNDFYLIMLTGEMAVADLTEVKIVHRLLTVLSADLPDAIAGQSGNGFLGGSSTVRQAGRSKEQEKEILTLLDSLEGVQEMYFEKYQHCVFSFPEAAGDWSEEAGMSRIIDMLMSSSSYFELDDARTGIAESGDTQDAQSGIADRAWLEQTIEDYFMDLDEVFVKSPKVVVRAIMATILAQLPPWFQTIEELKNYIADSLASCTDAAEKCTCIELLRLSMETTRMNDNSC